MLKVSTEKIKHDGEFWLYPNVCIHYYKNHFIEVDIDNHEYLNQIRDINIKTNSFVYYKIIGSNNYVSQIYLELMNNQMPNIRVSETFNTKLLNQKNKFIKKVQYIDEILQKEIIFNNNLTSYNELSNINFELLEYINHIDYKSNRIYDNDYNVIEKYLQNYIFNFMNNKFKLLIRYNSGSYKLYINNAEIMSNLNLGNFLAVLEDNFKINIEELKINIEKQLLLNN